MRQPRNAGAIDTQNLCGLLRLYCLALLNTEPSCSRVKASLSSDSGESRFGTSVFVVSAGKPAVLTRYQFKKGCYGGHVITLRRCVLHRCRYVIAAAYKVGLVDCQHTLEVAKKLLSTIEFTAVGRLSLGFAVTC